MRMMTFRKMSRATSATAYETWGGSDVANTINTFENTDVRATNLVVEDDEDTADAE